MSRVLDTRFRDVENDRGIELVDDVRLVAPARVFIRRWIESLGDDVPRRLVESAAVVPPAQSRLQRRLGDLLHAEIERRVDLQTLLVEVLDAVLRRVLDVLADLLGEVAADARRFLFVRAEGDGRIDRLPILIGFDVVLLQHAMKDVVPPRHRLHRMEDRAVRHRRADESRDRRRLRNRQLLRVLAEVEPRRRFDAVGAVPEVHLIRVELEDLVLREVLLDVDRQEHLVDLAAKALLGREEDLLGELLRQRRRPFDLLAGDEVLQAGAEDRFRIDAAVVVEVGILGGDDGVDQGGRHVALRYHDPLLNRVLRERDPLPVVDPRDDGRLVVLEILHQRHAHGVGEDESGGDAEDEDEEKEEPAAAGFHGKILLRSAGGGRKFEFRIANSELRISDLLHSLFAIRTSSSFKGRAARLRPLHPPGPRDSFRSFWRDRARRRRGR